MSIIGLLFIYFWSFQTAVQFLLQLNVKKDPSSMQCQDSNSQPLDHQSLAMTTRPGLTPIKDLHLKILTF